MRYSRKSCTKQGLWGHTN